VYLEKLYALRDTLHNRQTYQTIHDLKIAYETEKKEIEIERQQNIIARQNAQRNLFVVSVIVLVVFLALLWHMLRLRTKRNRALAETNATKDKFFNIISHDLKNPAVAQRDAIQLLVNSAGLWDADALTVYYKQLLKSADGQVELLFNLLRWAQLQTGRMIYTPVVINLSALFRTEIALINKIPENKGITLTVEMPDDAPVTGDGNMLAVVVRNLLTNAFKFTPSGGTVTLSVEPAPSNSPKGGGNSPPLEGLGEAYTVSVSDTGVGMNREQVEAWRISTLRPRSVTTPLNDRAASLQRMNAVLSSKGTAGEQGTGLGLIVCKEFLEKHGSELHVESEEGKGSRFWFII
jgi:signal transduction histidine kinase